MIYIRKSTKYAIVAVVLIVILWAAGVFTALAGLLSSAGAPAPSGSAGVWSALITDGTVATAAETKVIAVDGQSVDLYDGLADWQSVASNDNIVLTFDLTNENQGQTTDQFTAEGKIVSVPAPQGGAGTAFIVLKDGNGLWDVDYAGYASGSEPRDELRVTVVAQATDSGITNTMEANAAGFDDFQLAGNYDLTFSIGGIILTMSFHVTGA